MLGRFFLVRPVAVGQSYSRRVITRSVRSTALSKLKNRYRTRLVQKPNWTIFMGKSKNVYSGTRTFWCFRDRTNRKSVYRSTHFHFCPSISSNLAFVPISSDLLIKISYMFILVPTAGRRKSLSDSETGRPVKFTQSDKVTFWLFHFCSKIPTEPWALNPAP
jgi:hypothetical protein